jgi:dolichol-phosphate mannosyltransferase
MPGSEGDEIRRGAASPTQQADETGGATDTAPARLLVTVATYNEIENLPRLVNEIFGNAPSCELLVIDDNSPDGTGQWCDDRAAEDPRLHCLHREGKLGLGSAIVAGMKYGIERGFAYVLNMDADFSHNPRNIPDLVAGMDPNEPGRQPVDVMIGSRYIPGGGVEGWSLKRHFMSRGVNIYSRWLLWLRPKDCSGGFRCYRTSTLAKLDFDEIRSLGYSFQEEILWRLKRVGATFGEAPIVFVDRQQGESKINRGEAWAALRIILALGFRNWTGR